MAILLFVLQFADKLEAVGINPAEVQHAVVRREDHLTGLYATTSSVKDAAEAIRAGEKPNMVYTRIA